MNTYYRRLGSLLIACFVCQATVAAERPNIVFVLADDLAWADVGYNGNEFYETPNIDALAKSGMIFDRGYSGGPNCLPTRACLISGMYTPRTQIWTPGGRSKGTEKFMKLKVPSKTFKTPFPSKLSLKPEVVSVAEVLKSAGYRTARFGKWHVGPDTQGFDISDPSGKGAKVGQKFYGNIDVAEWLTDASVRFINDEPGTPFFLYLCHWDVHTPIKARKDVKAKFDEKLAGRTWAREWNTTYSAMISAVDTSVGRLMSALEEKGVADNTLFVFTSDNGGHAGATTNKPLKGAKGSLNEGGIHVPMTMRWPKVIKAGSRCDTPVTSVDFLPTFADVSGAELPTTQPVDGISLKRLMDGHSVSDRSVFWHYPLYLSGSGEGKVVPIFGTEVDYWRGVPASTIMKREWKLIHYFEDDSVKLYNLGDDPGEQRDLSTSNSARAVELLAELSAWQKETKAVIPTELNSGFDNAGAAKLQPASEGENRKKRAKKKNR